MVNCRIPYNSPSPGGRELIRRKIEDSVGTPGSLPNQRFGRVAAGGENSPSPNLSLQGRGIVYKNVGTPICRSPSGQ